jgi:hypothetical protein
MATSEWVSSMKSAHGKAAATMVEAMHGLLAIIGPEGTRNVFLVAIENGRCNCEVGPVVDGRATTPAEIERLVHQLAHKLAEGVQGLIDANVPYSTIRQIFNDSAASILANTQRFTWPDELDPTDPAMQKMVEEHLDLMERGII